MSDITDSGTSIQRNSNQSEALGDSAGELTSKLAGRQAGRHEGVLRACGGSKAVRGDFGFEFTQLAGARSLAIVASERDQIAAAPHR